MPGYRGAANVNNNGRIIRLSEDRKLLKTTAFFLCLAAAFQASAEEGCPPGQIPAQAGGGPASCGPIPQGYYQQTQPAPAQPAGEWLRTWGAIAVGVIDSIPRYGVPVGLPSEDAAKKEAMLRCERSGAQNCRIATTFRNQCASIGEPQINGAISPDGLIQFSREPSKQEAITKALKSCQEKNPGAECKVIYTACSEQVFRRY